jgi:hypothetical protein
LTGDRKSPILVIEQTFLYQGISMLNEICTVTAWVEIQGDLVLHFVRREKEYAEYEVIGYSDQVMLRDYRTAGLKAIDEVHDTRKADKFPYQFNAPALVNIPDLKSPTLSIELHDTKEIDPDHRLWIAVGITELPVYEYIHKRVVPFKDAFALVALYHRNLDRQSVSSSVSSAGI